MDLEVILFTGLLIMMFSFFKRAGACVLGALALVILDCINRGVIL